MVSTANGLRVYISQYHTSSHSKLGKVDEVICKFIDFSFSVFSIYTRSSHIHPSMHFFCSQRTLLCVYFIITSPCSLISLTSLQLHHHTFIIKLTSITSYLNYITCSKLITSPNSLTFYTIIITLYHSHIPPITPVTIHL